MTEILNVPNVDLLVLATNDPKFVATAQIAASAKREAAVRRAAVVVNITRMVLPAAAYLTYSFDERLMFGVRLLTIRAKDRSLLMATDDELLPEGVAVADLPQLSTSTADAIASMLAVVDSHDSHYVDGVDLDAPENDFGDTDVYELDLDAVMTDLAEIDQDSGDLLSADEAQAAGFDPTGCDGHPDFPYRRSLPTWQVYLRRSISTTVPVQGATALDALAKAMRKDFPLPPRDQWDGQKDWTVQVIGPDGEVVAENDI